MTAYEIGTVIISKLTDEKYKIVDFGEEYNTIRYECENERGELVPVYHQDIIVVG